MIMLKPFLVLCKNIYLLILKMCSYWQYLAVLNAYVTRFSKRVFHTLNMCNNKLMWLFNWCMFLYTFAAVFNRLVRSQSLSKSLIEGSYACV